jgi:hypothetical protein
MHFREIIHSPFSFTFLRQRKIFPLLHTAPIKYLLTYQNSRKPGGSKVRKGNATFNAESLVPSLAVQFEQPTRARRLYCRQHPTCESSLYEEINQNCKSLRQNVVLLSFNNIAIAHAMQLIKSLQVLYPHAGSVAFRCMDYYTANNLLTHRGVQLIYVGF